MESLYTIGQSPTYEVIMNTNSIYQQGFKIVDGQGVYSAHQNSANVEGETTQSYVLEIRQQHQIMKHRLN